MTSEHTPLEGLLHQLGDGQHQIAFEEGALGSTKQQASEQHAIEQAIQEAQSQGVGTVNVVVLRNDVPGAFALRDLAQDIQDHTHAETVFVRSPHQAGVVSSTYTRAEIESAIPHMVSQAETAAGIQAFASHIDTHPIPLAPIGAGVALTAVLTIVTAWWAVRERTT